MSNIIINNNTLQSHRNAAAFLKTDIHRLLLTSVGFCFLLLLARTVYTWQLTFTFLVWNLFLAFVPYFFSYTLTQRPPWTKSKWKFRAVLILWLLFIPNSFYMITDLFHLNDGNSMPRWYDLLLIFSFAWNALLLGILSVRHIEKLTTASWNYRSDWFFIYPVMLLNAMGIYIGRVLRYNSWDLFSNPFQLTAGILHILWHPVQYKNAWAMVFCFSFFLSILYVTLKRISKAV